MQFDVKEYYQMDQLKREEFLLGMVDDMANNYYQTEDEAFVTESPNTTHPRDKKQTTFKLAKPCINAPYSGGTVGVIYLLAPQILCPSVFSYVVLGPLVLSPFVLSPYVMGPFILSPEVLNPFILSPYVLSPTVLNPAVLSPLIVNPTVLSPGILSPLVLSPPILSPNVLSPLILNPFVLNPGILSPTVGSPNILSPFVLSPAILSPAVLFVNVLSPGVLSPSILSPSDGPNILSPCFACRRRKRSADGLTKYYEFDPKEFSKRLYWINEMDYNDGKNNVSWPQDHITEYFRFLQELLMK